MGRQRGANTSENGGSLGPRRLVGQDDRSRRAGLELTDEGARLMLDTLKALITNQLEAALCTLNACIDECPEAAWDAPVANLAFCQVVFHTLFFADCSLGQNVESLREQTFHRNHKSFFRNYEELEDRKPELLYDQPSIVTYLEFCRHKASEVVAMETADTLSGRCGFEWLPVSRSELYIYNIRHIQHHAAQLSLRLRLDANTNIRWVKSGWRDV